jgi:hypothetical protein
MFAAVVASSLFLQGTIDYETKAKSLDKVLAELSTQTGKTLVANPPMNREIVMLSVHRKPLREVMERLAAVTGSTVETTPKGWKLIVDPRARDAATKRAFDARVDLIAKAQRSLLDRLEKTAPFNAQALTQQTRDYESRYGANMFEAKAIDAATRLRYASPGHRPLSRLVAGLDPIQLAKIPDEGVLVFSDQPRKMQFPLGQAARETIRETAREQAGWVDAYRSDGTFEKKRSWISGDPRASTEPLDPAKTRLVLRVDGGSYGRLPTFTGYFAEPDGASLVTMNVSLEADVLPPPSRPRTEPPSFEDEPDIKLSDEAVAHLRSFSTLTWKLKAGPANGQARQMLLDPVRYEPLGFAVSEALLQTARMKRLDLVACLPDDAINVLWQFMSPEGTLKRAKPSRLLSVLPATATEKDQGWLTIHPRAVSPRCDREQLAKFLVDVDRDGCVRLDPYADFALAVGEPAQGHLVRNLLDSLLPGATSTIGNPLVSSVRLYGMLPASLRQRARNGDSLRIGDLPKEVLAELQTQVFYRSGQGLTVAARPAKRGESRFHNVFREPTEALPNGISPDGTFQFEVLRNPAFFIDTSFNNQGQPMPLTTVAAHLLIPEIPRLNSHNQMGTDKIGTLRTGRQEMLHGTWQLAPGAVWNDHYIDNVFNLRSPRVTLETLPEAWKKDLDEAVATRRKRELEADKRLGRTPSTATPPP